VERARLLIERAEALGEPPEDPLLLFSVLYGFWVANLISSNCDALGELAAQFLALAEKQRLPLLRMIGHRIVGAALLLAGDFAKSREHLDRAFAFYDPPKHRPLATRFGQDLGVSIFGFRTWTMWVLDYPEAALADAEHAIKDAREIGQAVTLMYALACAVVTIINCGNYAAANGIVDELIRLSDDKSASWWKAVGTLQRGCLFSLSGKAADAVEMITSGLNAQRSTGATFGTAARLSDLARAYGDLGRFEDAWRCIDDAMAAMEKTKDKWWEAEVHRVAGEIALNSPEHDASKAEAYFERALAIARQQQAKSWELRASMSLARLWRDQGKVQQARELLAPVYGWFTEGFETRDLKDAKALLEELQS
jgi:predicted ATPase